MPKSSSYTDSKGYLGVSEQDKSGSGYTSEGSSVGSEVVHRSRKRRLARWAIEKAKSHSRTFQSYEAMTRLGDDATEEDYLSAAAIRAPKLVQTITEIGGIDKMAELGDAATEASESLIVYSGLMTYQDRAIKAQKKREKASQSSTSGSGVFGRGKGKSRQTCETAEEIDQPLTDAELSEVRTEVLSDFNKVIALPYGEETLLKLLSKQPHMSKSKAQKLFDSVGPTVTIGSSKA